MDIWVEHEQASVPVTVLRIKGDLRTGDELATKAKELIERGMHNILLDLSAVPYITSDGLRAINVIYRLLRTNTPAESDEAIKRGIAAGTYYSPHLKLLKPAQHVLEVLKMTGYDMFLEIHTNFQQAIDSFQK